MARVSTRPLWTKRKDPPPQDWCAADDAELCQMVRLGLDSHYYQVGLPHRTFGDILARRLQLIKAGQLQRAPDI